MSKYPYEVVLGDVSILKPNRIHLKSYDFCGITVSKEHAQQNARFPAAHFITAIMAHIYDPYHTDINHILIARQTC